MTNTEKWYVMIMAGLAVMLGGFVWDALLHANEHAHLVVQALFDPSNPFENPAHLVIAIGLVWTSITTLGGFTTSWLEGKNWRNWQSLVAPLALWLVMGIAGIVSLVVLGQTR